MTEPTMPVVEERDGRKALVVDGVIQSIVVTEEHVFDVWDAFIPVKRLPWHALILGAGGGTIATLLTQRCGPIQIVAIERDPAVARLARQEFGLAHLTNVTLVEADGFEWVAESDQSFDLICVDMYVGGELAHGTLATAFLRDVARILTPGGTAVFNLFKTRRLPEQLRRLRHIFTVAEQIEIGGNVVVHVRHD